MERAEQIRKFSFLFARIHFVGLFQGDGDKHLPKFLEEVQKKTIEDGRYSWAFGDIGTTKIDGRTVIYGRLGRTVTEKFEIIYDEIKHSYKKELVRSSEAAYANFFLLPEFHSIVFEEKYNLGKNTFVKYFKKFWEIGKSIVEIDFEFIKDEVEIFKLIKTWNSITKATFYLKPSNPNSRQDWKDVDEIIRKAKAKRAKLEFENKKGTLEKNNSIIQQGMSMAASGYGDFMLRGFKGDSPQSYNSKTNIAKREVVQKDDFDLLARFALEEILKMLKGK